MRQEAALHPSIPINFFGSDKLNVTPHLNLLFSLSALSDWITSLLSLDPIFKLRVISIKMATQIVQTVITDILAPDRGIMRSLR